MLRGDASRKRCAIYTRKFSEEGLSPTRSTNGVTRARIVSPRGSTIRSPRGEGSAATGRIAAFTPPKGARALLPAANNGGKGAGPFHPARSWR